MTPALGDDWPAHWERSNLGEIATVVTSGSRDWKPYYNQGTGVFILTQNVRMRDLDLSEPFHVSPPEDDPARKRSAVQIDDLLINIVGGVGTVARVARDLPDHYVCQSVALVRLADPDLSQFVELYLSSPNGGQRHFTEATYGIGRPHLSFADIKETPVPLPPPDERAQIIRRLESLTGHVALAAEHFERALSGCTDYRRSCLNEVLFANPARMTTIGEVGSVFVGATPSRKNADFWGGSVPWVSSGEVAFCRIQSTRETITEAGLGNRSRRLHPPGTVMLAMIGEGKTRGQAAILDIAAAHNQNSAAIRLDPTKMQPEYLYYSLMAQYEDNRRSASGSQQPALSGKLVGAIEVPFASLGDQRAAVGAIERHFDRVQTLEVRLQAALLQARRLRASILRDAFTGALSTRASSQEEYRTEDAAVLIGQ